MTNDKGEKNAQELATLAAKVPGEIGQLSKNVYPKGLKEELKQFEKLAKRPCADINH